MTILGRSKNLLWSYYHAYILMDLCLKDPDRTERDKAQAKINLEKYRNRVNVMHEVLAGHLKTISNVEYDALTKAYDQYQNDYNKTKRYWWL